MHIHIQIYTYTHVYIYVYICICIYIYMYIYIYPIALRACSATGLHSWCRLPGECLLRRHQKSSQTSAMTGGNAGLFGISPCVLHWVAALCGWLGRPEKAPKSVEISKRSFKMLLGRPSGGHLGPAGPPRAAKSEKRGSGR